VDIKRGEIYFADLGNDGVGSEQNGTRPVLIVQNNIGNRFSPTVVVACVTSNVYKNQIPTHVRWGQSLILCEQIKTIDKVRLLNKIGVLTDFETADVNRALKLSMGLQ
jgi:mRNA interferase MazF